MPLRNLAALFLLGLLLGGCGTLPDGTRWGENATIAPGWERIGWAAKRAALDPMTWAPAAGALVFAIGDFDEKVSDWAVEQRPIFGSEDGSSQASSLLRSGLIVTAYGSIALTPSGGEAGPWFTSKAKGGLVEWGAWGATVFSTTALQNVTHRTRPNELNDHSFPSAHTSQSFACATLFARNLDSIPMSDFPRESLRVAGYTAAGLAGWSRIEGEHHFPSDVLVGAALGHFLSAFIHDAFIGLPIEIEPSLDGVIVEFSIGF